MIEIITSCDAKSACFNGSGTSCDIISGCFGEAFGRKRSHHVMDASCQSRSICAARLCTTAKCGLSACRPSVWAWCTRSADVKGPGHQRGEVKEKSQTSHEQRHPAGGPSQGLQSHPSCSWSQAMELPAMLEHTSPAYKTTIQH